MRLIIASLLTICINALGASLSLGPQGSVGFVPDSALSSNVILKMPDGSMISSHMISSTTPTITAGAGAGTGPTCTVEGTDVSGKITVTCGTLTVGINATICTVNYGTAYSTSSYPVLQPGNANAAILVNTAQVFVTGNPSNFVITSGALSVTAGTQYIWYYSGGGK